MPTRALRPLFSGPRQGPAALESPRSSLYGLLRPGPCVKDARTNLDRALPTVLCTAGAISVRRLIGFAV